MTAPALSAGDRVIVSADGWDVYLGEVVALTDRKDPHGRRLVSVKRTERKRMHRNGRYPVVGEPMDVPGCYCIRCGNPDE